MVKLPEGKAKTLKQAFQLCDVGPLDGEFLERYYVDLSAVRNEESISGINARLDFLDPGQFASVLFTGHRGCGKSTELRKLQTDWEKSHRVIYIESDNEIDLNDADYIDLYLVIIKQITDDLVKLGLLLNAFELMTNHGYVKGYLGIFDNLDRMPLDVGDRLYFNQTTQLQALNCIFIYTVPISAVYSAKNLNTPFSQPNIFTMPMVNI